MMIAYKFVLLLSFYIAFTTAEPLVNGHILGSPSEVADISLAIPSLEVANMIELGDESSQGVSTVKVPAKKKVKVKGQRKSAKKNKKEAATGVCFNEIMIASSSYYFLTCNELLIFMKLGANKHFRTYN